MAMIQERNSNGVLPENITALQKLERELEAKRRNFEHRRDEGRLKPKDEEYELRAIESLNAVRKQIQTLVEGPPPENVNPEELARIERAIDMAEECEAVTSEVVNPLGTKRCVIYSYPCTDQNDRTPREEMHLRTEMQLWRLLYCLEQSGAKSSVALLSLTGDQEVTISFPRCQTTEGEPLEPAEAHRHFFSHPEDLRRFFLAQPPDRRFCSEYSAYPHLCGYLSKEQHEEIMRIQNTCLAHVDKTNAIMRSIAALPGKTAVFNVNWHPTGTISIVFQEQSRTVETLPVTRSMSTKEYACMFEKYLQGIHAIAGMEKFIEQAMLQYCTQETPHGSMPIASLPRLMELRSVNALKAQGYRICIVRPNVNAVLNLPYEHYADEEGGGFAVADARNNLENARRLLAIQESAFLLAATLAVQPKHAAEIGAQLHVSNLFMSLIDEQRLPLQGLANLHSTLEKMENSDIRDAVTLREDTPQARHDRYRAANNVIRNIVAKAVSYIFPQEAPSSWNDREKIDVFRATLLSIEQLWHRMRQADPSGRYCINPDEDQKLRESACVHLIQELARLHPSYSALFADNRFKEYFTLDQTASTPWAHISADPSLSGETPQTKLLSRHFHDLAGMHTCIGALRMDILEERLRLTAIAVGAKLLLQDRLLRETQQECFGALPHPKDQRTVVTVAEQGWRCILTADPSHQEPWALTIVSSDDGKKKGDQLRCYLNTDGEVFGGVTPAYCPPSNAAEDEANATAIRSAFFAMHSTELRDLQIAHPALFREDASCGHLVFLRRNNRTVVLCHAEMQEAVQRLNPAKALDSPVQEEAFHSCGFEVSNTALRAWKALELEDARRTYEHLFTLSRAHSRFFGEQDDEEHAAASDAERAENGMGHYREFPRLRTLLDVLASYDLRATIVRDEAFYEAGNMHDWEMIDRVPRGRYAIVEVPDLAMRFAISNDRGKSALAIYDAETEIGEYQTDLHSFLRDKGPLTVDYSGTEQCRRAFDSIVLDRIIRRRRLYPLGKRTEYADHPLLRFPDPLSIELLRQDFKTAALATVERREESDDSRPRYPWDVTTEDFARIRAGEQTFAVGGPKVGSSYLDGIIKLLRKNFPSIQSDDPPITALRKYRSELIALLQPILFPATTRSEDRSGWEDILHTNIG